MRFLLIAFLLATQQFYDEDTPCQGLNSNCTNDSHPFKDDDLEWLQMLEDTYEPQDISYPNYEDEVVS